MDTARALYSQFKHSLTKDYNKAKGTFVFVKNTPTRRQKEIDMENQMLR